jgi:peptide/nickel transport system ATP-binding protein
MSAARSDHFPGPGLAAANSAPSPAGPVLAIRDLCVVYRTPGGDVRAVDQVNLELQAGEVVGLAGESGSGKSTLAYGACRLLRAPALITSGSVRYHGRRTAGPVEILRMGADELRRLRWREIAIVFQSAMNALNPVLSVRNQLLDVIHAHLRVSKDEARDRVGSLLDLVSIPRSRLRSYPHELSGGMRQRVMIAMALAADPEIVIMDEPTTALDVVVQRDILAQIVELKERLAFSIVFITHDLSLLLELADRIAVMYAGQLLEIGTAQEIQHEPAHPYTKGLLNSFPSLRGPRRELAGIPGSPPDLRRPPPGCAFLPRCGYGRDACTSVDMHLAPVASSPDREHVTACPFVLPDTPVPAGTAGHPAAGSSDVSAPPPAPPPPAPPPPAPGAPPWGAPLAAAVGGQAGSGLQGPAAALAEGEPGSEERRP